MNRSDYNEFMMHMAFTVSCNSRDPHRKVGAVIVKNHHIISYGWNGTPYDYPTNQCKDEYGDTLPEVVHAEINAICKAASSTVSTQGATMYSTTVPCVECAKAIVQSGISIVYYEQEYNKCSKGKDLLKKCNVTLIKLED